MRVKWETIWFPALIGLVIIAAHIIAALEKGYYSRSFNSVIFLPPPLGIVITLSCLVLLGLSVIRLDWLQAFQPGITFRVLSFCLASAAFILMVGRADPLLPNLFGDGGFLLQYEVFPRLRTDLVRLVSDLAVPRLLEKPYFRLFPLEYTMPYVSLVLGGIYILTSFFLVMNLLHSFSGRLAGLAYFAFFPSVVNFAGHWDSYSILLSCLTAFFAFALTAEEKKSPLLLLPALAALFLAVWEKQLAAVVLLYPVMYLLFRLFQRGTGRPFSRALPPLLALGLLSTAGTALIIYGVPFSQLGQRVRTESFGRAFRSGLSQEGILRTLYYPANTILPVVLPLIIVGLAMVLSRSARRKLGRHPGARSAFWVALLLAGGYYTMQLLNPIAAYGSLDFLVHSGTLGGLLVVPVFLVVVKSAKNWLPGLAVLGFFLTIPPLCLQSRPAYFFQLESVLPEERWILDDSLLGHAAGRALSLPGPAAKEYTGGLFFPGTENELNQRRFRPLKSFYAVVEGYAYARERGTESLLREYLECQPEVFDFLLAVKPHQSRRLITPGMLSAAGKIARELFDLTGNEIYLSLISAVELRDERLLECSDWELAAVLAWLDYLGDHGTPELPDEIISLAQETLDRVSSARTEKPQR